MDGSEVGKGKLYYYEVMDNNVKYVCVQELFKCGLEDVLYRKMSVREFFVRTDIPQLAKTSEYGMSAQAVKNTICLKANEKRDI